MTRLIVISTVDPVVQDKSSSIYDTLRFLLVATLVIIGKSNRLACPTKHATGVACISRIENSARWDVWICSDVLDEYGAWNVSSAILARARFGAIEWPETIPRIQ